MNTKLTVRKAEIKDVPSILKLLIQVDMVHHLGRPDLFKGPATKYSKDEFPMQKQADTTTLPSMCGTAIRVQRNSMNHLACNPKRQLWRRFCKCQYKI